MPAVGTTHHVKIGDIFCTLTPGGYRKRPAPMRGARIATGDPDYNDLSIWQHWVQHCWAGGIGADKWVDDSMFDSGVGVDTTIHEQASLSRDLSLATGGALDAASLDVKRVFKVFKKENGNKRLYCVTMPAEGSGVASKVWKFVESTETWTLQRTFGTSIQATAVAIHSGEFSIGFTNGKIKSTTDPDDADSWVNRNPPKGVTQGVASMKRYRQRLYVAYGDKVYRRKRNWKIDGKTVFYNPAGSSKITSMEIHLGFLYMGSENGHIHRTDGNNSFDIWSWDGGTQVTSLRSFDGRLFVGTYEFTDDDTVGAGGIYQLTGSAVTQLKRWGKIDRSTIIGDFTVYDRRLFYGASNLWGMNENAAGTDLGGFGVAVYDPVEDAHSIWASNKDTTTYPDSSGTGADWIVDDVIWWNGYMHASVRGHGNFRTLVQYRDYLEQTINYDTTTTAALGGSNNGFLVSSLYDAGTPGLDKIWRKATVEANMDNNNVTVELQYSTDIGSNWTSLGTLQRSLTGTHSISSASDQLTGSSSEYLQELEPGDAINVNGTTVTIESVESDTAATLTANAGATESGVAANHTKEVFQRVFEFGDVRAPRIQYRLVLGSSSATQSPVVRAVTISYLPIPEPNWMWDLTISVAPNNRLMDGTTDTQSMDTLVSTLGRYFRDQVLIEFIDKDGTVWAGSGSPGALVWDFNEDMHVMGETTGLEAQGMIRCTIIEVAEDY
jgi:hypothetical protein